MSRIVIGVVVCLFFAACEPNELPIPKHVQGDVRKATVNVNTDYRYQVYYNLERNEMVGRVLKSTWDFAFEASPNGFNIKLNSGKAMYAFQSTQTDITQPLDTAGFGAGKRFDAPNGNMNETAIGNWRNHSNVYIVDRGYNEMGTSQGMIKLKILEATATNYTFETAQLNGSNHQVFTVSKNENYNFVYFSCNTFFPLLVEPPKNTWDIQFAQYTEQLSEAYLVMGCLLNPTETAAIMDSSMAFNQIDFAYASTKVLSTHANSIGYDWKTFSFDLATYTVNPRMNYIIKTQQGVFYKLHFIDFYDKQGNKGNPVWEYQPL